MLLELLPLNRDPSVAHAPYFNILFTHKAKTLDMLYQEYDACDAGELVNTIAFKYITYTGVSCVYTHSYSNFHSNSFASGNFFNVRGWKDAEAAVEVS